jgi:hypothetical protein
MITETHLSATVGITGQSKCDCGCIRFEVGIAKGVGTDNLFIRILQCVDCSKQILVGHSIT